MNKATTLGGLALVLAVAGLALGFLAFTQARDANTKADNIITTLEEQARLPMKDDGTVDEEELQKLMQQQQQQRQPSQEEIEELEEQQQSGGE